jgi:hypothetical protein
MEIPFAHQGYQGRVSVTVETTLAPPVLGAPESALGLANCKATIEYTARGYLGLLGWVQLVCSTDNSFHGRQFEMDPFDPFQLYEQALSPYCWYGITPTLFDAPSRDERAELDWIAHSFLAVSPFGDNSRIVTPLLGFSWGFHVTDDTRIELKPVTALTAADWEAHLPYLRTCYQQWQFKAMPIPSNKA